MPDIQQIAEELETAFPALPYSGTVTYADGEQFSEEIDDDLALFRYLSGRDWKSIEPSFIDFQYASLPLLTDPAFVAFFPAWLLRSLSPECAEAPLRAHLVYTLAAGLKDSRDDRLKLFDETQRNVVGAALAHLVRMEDGDRLRAEVRAVQESLKSARR